LEVARQAFPVVIIDGPRGVGKTTSALRLAASVVYLPEDSERLRIDPAAFLAALPRPVLIDEWQLAGTDLLWTIKRVVDTDASPGQFILTGSVEPASYGPTFPLTARAAQLMLRPMTVAEMAGRGNAPTFLEKVLSGVTPSPSAGRSTQFTLDWLTRPGFPAARSMIDAELFLQTYAAFVAHRAGDEGRDATRLLRTLRVLAAVEAETVPDERIWSAADVTKVTWKHYDDLLTRTHVSTPSPAFSSNRLKRLTSYPKRFLADVSLSLALAEIDTNRLRDTPSLAGHYIESFAMQQLRPQIDKARGSLTHLRTAAGEREVDAVIEVGDAIIGIEVKHTSRPGISEAKQLAWFRREYDDRFHSGYVLHTGGDTYQLGDQIWAIPIDTLWDNLAASEV
jgi:hypothetical protein